MLVQQLLVGLGAFGALALLGPKLLSLEDEIAAEVLSAWARLAVVALMGTGALTLARLRADQPNIEALARSAGPRHPQEIERVADLPTILTMRFFALSSVVSSALFIRGIRPDKLDDERAISLLVLAITIHGAAALPHYLLTRAATVGLLERSPIEQVGALLEKAELYQTPRRRVTQKLLLAVAAPVLLVGVGAVLTAHAHLRTFLEQSRQTTAVLIARAALEPSRSGRGEPGRADAIAAAAELGFIATRRPERLFEAEPSFERENDGQIAVTVPLDDGRAVIRFSANLDPAIGTWGALTAILAVLVAGAAGLMFGRVLAGDLLHATRRVRLLGTDSVLRGATQIARPARFKVVARLGLAIEDLTARFRVFAAAQERALEAREAAQRMRGLLFASVSHDLKSPLNSILGFAELVGQERLTPAQQESLGLIATRGRELLGLIETILDAARVEAGQLTLESQPTDVAELVSGAIRKAHELASDVNADIAVEIAAGLPWIPVDRAYATRALAVILAHALRVGTADPSARIVRLTAAFADLNGDYIRIEIDYGSRDVPPAELEALFNRQTTARGRGLTLGLSHARSVVELHGGSLEVLGALDGRPLCLAFFPKTPPHVRPRLSSFPTLG
ncbi:sensor histidine kinase [Chondromyces crocatus]|uniref:sensor histidine kinase n=1 Tax=Chondromyces crocatus TaxID=52 RepID=UPI00067ABB2B|nr:HAMP domain-containing sensor histidine kinase [Chondromyces crocatus]